MRFSIIVPVHNTAAHLDGVLGALLARELPAGRVRILAVDNNSTDASPAILARTPGSAPWRSRPRWSARNHAVRESRGDVLAFTDSNCLPSHAIDHALETATRRWCWDAGARPAKRVWYASWPSREGAPSSSRRTPPAGLRVHQQHGRPPGRDGENSFGPFVERPRGSDTIFVRRVVEALGCDAVVYKEIRPCVSPTPRWTASGPIERCTPTDAAAAGYKHVTTPEQRHPAPAVPGDRSRQPYSWFSAVALAVVPAGGMAAWSVGSLSHAWSKTPVR